MKEIILTQGQVALVDDADFETLNAFKWCAQRTPRGNFYAVRCVWRANKTRQIKMHRLVMDAPDGLEVDHIFGKTLDNRKGQLRLCTRTQNQHNRGKTARASSIYKGVCLVARYKLRPWKATIRAEEGVRKQTRLGFFATEIEAARAYDAAAALHFGKFAKLNFPCLSS